MRRTVSRFLATALAKKHYSMPFHEAGTACSPMGQVLRNNYINKLQSYQLNNENNMPHLGGQIYVRRRLYSAQSAAEAEEVPVESELRRKVGWMIKILAAITITYVSFNMFPIMGDSLIWQSVALVRLDDPFMKRSGASRIAMIATNDRRRKNFVEAGGVTELVKMLESAPDDKTRGEAVKALVSLCECEVAVEALHATGAECMLKSLSQDSSDGNLESQSLALLKKLKEWKGGPK